MSSYHHRYTAWFVNAEGLHCLKHIRNPLCLAALNRVDESTEYSTASYSVTKDDEIITITHGWTITLELYYLRPITEQRIQYLQLKYICRYCYCLSAHMHLLLIRHGKQNHFLIIKMKGTALPELRTLT